MEKSMIRVCCGEGPGKTTYALGRALVCASQGQEVFVIQFLKGRMAADMNYFKRLEPEIKVFRFEKADDYYLNLPEQEQEEEIKNIRNGLNFARKVLSIGECDLLVLDEILGLVDLGIIQVEEVIKLLEVKDDNIEVILTGRALPQELVAYADLITSVNVVKKCEN